MAAIPPSHSLSRSSVTWLPVSVCTSVSTGCSLLFCFPNAAMLPSVLGHIPTLTTCWSALALRLPESALSVQPEPPWHGAMHSASFIWPPHTLNKKGKANEMGDPTVSWVCLATHSLKTCLWPSRNYHMVSYEHIYTYDDEVCKFVSLTLSSTQPRESSFLTANPFHFHTFNLVCTCSHLVPNSYEWKKNNPQSFI